MIERVALESLLLFLAPFAIFAIYLALRSIYPLEMEHWTRGRVSWLTLTGLGLALGFLVSLELLAPRAHGVYVPAHIENGVLVEGRFK
jgi:Family of unknown function (DUF6111)